MIDKAKAQRLQQRDGVILDRLQIEHGRVSSHAGGCYTALRQSPTAFNDIQAASSTSADTESGSEPDTDSEDSSILVRSSIGPSETGINGERGILHAEPEGRSNTFSWDAIDVTRSPDLGKLIGALTLFELQELPRLDIHFDYSSKNVPMNVDDMLWYVRGKGKRNTALDSSDAQAVLLSDLAAVRRQSPEPFPSFHIVLPGSMANPPLGLSPFPRSTKFSTPIRVREPGEAPSRHFPYLTELECVYQMRALSKLAPTQVQDLVHCLWDIAFQYHNLQQWKAAETWYRRIVTAKQKISKRNPDETIKARLHVITCLQGQGRYAEARSLHKNVHVTVERTTSPSHELALESKRTLAVQFCSLGETRKEGDVRRELVQIHLTKFGLTNIDTLVELKHLAYHLASFGRYAESEQLLTTCLNLQSQALQAGESMPKTFNIYDTRLNDTKLILARTLRKAKKYKDAQVALDSMMDPFKWRVSTGDSSSFHYHFELGMLAIIQDRLLEADQILQDLLHSQKDVMRPSHIFQVMKKLAKISTKLGHLGHAVVWHQRSLPVCVDAYGLEHKRYINTCRDLGRCYAAQGYYDRALQCLYETIFDIRQLDKKDDDASEKGIVRLQEWIWDVEMQKNLAENLEM